MQNKKIIIIGAGIAGLSAGCYSAMNGFETHIFEANHIPGGLCTSWNKGNFIIDGSIHHLAGLNKKSLYYKIWEELGTMPAPVTFFKDLSSVETLDGMKFYVSTDIEKLKRDMLDTAPEDKETIYKYFKLLYKFKKMDILEAGLWGIGGFIKNLAGFLSIMKYMKVTMASFADNFSNPFLKKAFRFIQYDWQDVPIPLHANIMTGCYMQRYGWYNGGSLEFAKAIEKKFKSLGGMINYGTKIEKIIAENGRAEAFLTSDKTRIEADYIISNSFGYNTIFNMLDGRYLSIRDKEFYNRPGDDAKMGLQVSFGINRDMRDQPHAVILFLDGKLKAGGRDFDRLNIEIFNFDQKIAPAGKTVIKVIMDTGFKYWRDLYREKDNYKNEKEKLAEDILMILDKKYPGIKSQVEMTDVATPVTTERFTSNAEPYGAQLEMKPSDLMNSLFGKPKKLPGIKNLFLVGQSVGGAGIPGCALMGKNTVKNICMLEKRRFRADRQGRNK